MGISRDEKELRHLCNHHSKWLRTAKHGDLYQFPNGAIVSVPRSGASHDPRTWKNSLAEARKAYQESFPTLEVEEVVKTTKAIEKLSVTKKRTITETTEILIGVQDLMSILELTGEGHMEDDLEHKIEVVKLIVKTVREE